MASPVEITQQLARIDTLHTQLKAETIRAQEFLLKLRQDEIEALNQAQTKASGRNAHQEDMAKNSNIVQKEKKERDRVDRKESTKASNVTHSHDGLHAGHQGVPATTGAGRGGSETQKESMCRCSCPHHPLSPAVEAKLKEFAESCNIPSNPHTHVDEREVRDLEKRVRGLEGRVRGFEGLPPDREMALLEVERLRRELEGLARRREGLFEGLSGSLVESNSAKKGGKSISGTGKALGILQGNGKAATNGKAVGKGKK